MAYVDGSSLQGEYDAALSNYNNAIVNIDENVSKELLDHNVVCKSGVARMCIHEGDISRGVQIACELEGKTVKRECAHILEQMKQYNEAARLYELGGFCDRAAAAHLKSKNWIEVGKIISKVRSSKIHRQYGKAMETEKKYKKAALAYKNARDYDNLVRILLDHLDHPEEAVKIVRESRSIEGARLVARFFSNLGDSTSAVQFLVLSQCFQEAFHLAANENKMDVYAEAIDECGTVNNFIQLADYYATTRNSHTAGKYYLKANEHKKALDYLLMNSNDTEAIKTAIECVAQAKDADLCATLVTYLRGESDGVQKNAKLLFRYYITMKMNKDAAKMALVIARDEQSRGAYRMAHKLLFEMQQELITENISVPVEIDNNLMMLHSYLLVKGMVKRGEDHNAARLLIRVSDNIHLFPQRMVSREDFKSIEYTPQILTSAVIECSKVGFKSSAFKYAVQLMKPENRKKVDSRYAKKIEAVVRKSSGNEIDEFTESPCPFCTNSIDEYELLCNSCQNRIPYCIVTGKHLRSEDCAACLACKFSGFYSEFIKIRDRGEKCPMCDEDLSNVVPSSMNRSIMSCKK